MESEFSTPHNSSRKQGQKIGQLIKACKAIAVELSHLEYEKEKWLKEMKVLETNIWSRIWDSEKWSAEIRKNAVMDSTHVASSLDKGDAADSSGIIGQGEMVDKEFVHGVFASSSEGNFSLSLREKSIAEMCILSSSQEKMSAYPMDNHAYERETSTHIGSEDDPCFLCPKESFSRREDRPADFELPLVTSTAKAMEHCLVSEEISPSFSEEQDISIVDTSVWNDDENFCPQNLPEMQWSNVSAGDCNAKKHSSVPEHETHVSFFKSEDLSTLDSCVKNGDENFWHEGRPATRWSNISSHDCEGMKISSVSEEQTHVSRLFDEEKGVLNAEASVQIDDENLCSRDLPERIWSIVSSDDSESSSENKESNRMFVIYFSKESNELENLRECKDKFEMEHETLVAKEKEGLENVLMDRKKCLEDVQSYTLELERAEMETNNASGVLEKPSSELFNLTMDVLEFDYEGSKTVLKEAIRHATLLDKERQSLTLDLAKHRRTFERACEVYRQLEKEMHRIQSNLNNRESNLDRLSCENITAKCEKRDVDEAYKVLIAEFGKNEHHGLACHRAMESGKGQDMVSIETELYEKKRDEPSGVCSGSKAIVEEMQRKDNTIRELEEELSLVKMERENLTRMLETSLEVKQSLAEMIREDEETVREVASAEEMEAILEGGVQSHEDGVRRLEIGTSSIGGDEMAVPEDDAESSIGIMVKETEAEDFDVEEEDRCLLEECRSFEGQFTKIQPVRFKKDIIIVGIAGSFQHNIGFSEMVSRLVELEVLKRVALERNFAMMPTVRST